MSVTPHRMFQQPWPEGELRYVQLGFIVDDIGSAATSWARVFGVGPFHVRPHVPVPCTYRGAESSVDMEVAVAQAGPVQIELIKQHCDHPSVISEGRAVFHQICTVTPDYDGKKGYYAELGYDLVSEIIIPGFRVAYFDMYRDFGFYTEVVEETPAFLEHLARVSQTCAAWDGLEPVK